MGWGIALIVLALGLGVTPLVVMILFAGRGVPDGAEDASAPGARQ